jgi:hypothetical protein
MSSAAREEKKRAAEEKHLVAIVSSDDAKHRYVYLPDSEVGYDTLSDSDGKAIILSQEHDLPRTKSAFAETMNSETREMYTDENGDLVCPPLETVVTLNGDDDESKAFVVRSVVTNDCNGHPVYVDITRDGPWNRPNLHTRIRRIVSRCRRPKRRRLHA